MMIGNSIKLSLLALFSLMTVAQPLGAQSGSFEPYRYPSQEKIDRQVDSVFRKLSTREKIAQIMVIDFTSADSEKMQKIQKRLVKKEKIGGIIPLGEKSYPGAIARMNRLNSWAKIPMLVTLDAEWGVGMRWGEVLSYPNFMQLGALSSDSLVYEVGRSIAAECRALKIQVNYSPVVDINNNPHKFIVNHRTFGEDKEKVAQYAAAMMHGMKDGGVAGSAKHFPGHGETDVDSHLALPLLPFSLERLDSLELYPFRRLIAEGVDMVMVGHMNIPAFDPSGTPSSISKPIVTGLLREKLGFDGIIITDALNMYGVSKDSGLEKRDIPLAAYKAGVDILLMPEDVEESISVIENALRNGEITMESLDMRVKKMLAIKARLGVLDKGYDPIANTAAIDGLRSEKLALVDKISEQTMTLVFNDNSQGFGIPVSTAGKRVVYVGFGNPDVGNDFAEVAGKYGKLDTLLLGNDASLEDLKAAKEKVKDYDLVIFGFNRTFPYPSRNFGLVEEQVNFITGWAASQPMIAVYLGSPYALTKIPGYKNFKAYIVGYTDTKANARAAAKVVFGAIQPKGVLPVTAGEFPAGHGIF